MIKLDKTLIKGSFILLVVFNLYSLLNFIFQSSMARFLTVAEYGILAALFYFVYLLGIYSEAIQTIITRYTASEANLGKLKNMLKRALKKSWVIAIISFLVYNVIAIPLSAVLNIPYFLLFLTGFAIGAAFFLPITRGILLGRRRFTVLGMNMIIESSSKLILATILVLLGWKIYGALIGLLVGVFLALGISFLSLKKVLQAKEEQADMSGIYGYSGPVFTIIFALQLFFIIDILIAQAVFSKDIAGYYAIASMLSKIIFWGTQPISRAMFPLAAEKQNNNKRESRYLNALGFLSICIFGILILFLLFPEEIIFLFSGRNISESTEILLYLGIATSLLSFANLNILYKISRGKTANAYLFLIILLIGVGLLLYFNHSLIEYTIAFLLTSAIFLWASIMLLKK